MVLFMDELHMLVGTGAAEGSTDARCAIVCVLFSPLSIKYATAQEEARYTALALLTVA